MALSPEQVCNIALRRVGQRQTIDSLTEETEPAEACNDIWEHCRDLVLSEFAWTFAEKRAELAEVATEEVSDWEGVWALPTDCLVPLYLWTGARAPAAKDRTPFAISGRRLLTDDESPELVYTSLVSTVSLYPPHFVDALAWKLAAELVFSLPVKPQLADQADRRYQFALAKAMAADLRKEQRDIEPDSDLYTVR